MLAPIHCLPAIPHIQPSPDLAKTQPTEVVDVKTKEPLKDHNNVIIMVDPVSTGANVAVKFLEHGYQVFALWSNTCTAQMRALTSVQVNYLYKIDQSQSHDEVKHLSYKLLEKSKQLNLIIVGCIAGSESGVVLAETLSNDLQLPSNNIDTVILRRDKYLMHEACKQHNLKIPYQAIISSYEETKNFLEILPEQQVVLKPRCSAGSDGVILCNTSQEISHHISSALGTKDAFNQINQTLLIQEYIEGCEYVIDSVVRHGVVKVMAVWKYEKGPANGASFVYHGMNFVCSSSPEYQELIDFNKLVLKAVGIEYGASHMEIILSKKGPVLIEVAARPHGSEGAFIAIAERCVGYSQIDGIVYAYGDSPSKFNSLPDEPPPLQVHGRVQDIICSVNGTLVDIRHINVIQSLASYVDTIMLPSIGSHLSKTVDLFSSAGLILLAHPDENVLNADSEYIKKLYPTMFVVASEE